MTTPKAKADAMSRRDYHVAGQRPDWRGARPADTRADRRASKRMNTDWEPFDPPRTRIVLRDGMYWQADKPPFRGEPPEVPTDEPHTWSESWPFIACIGAIAIALYVASAFGWLP